MVLRYIFHDSRSSSKEFTKLDVITVSVLGGLLVLCIAFLVFLQICNARSRRGLTSRRSPSERAPTLDVPTEFRVLPPQKPSEPKPVDACAGTLGPHHNMSGTSFDDSSFANKSSSKGLSIPEPAYSATTPPPAYVPLSLSRSTDTVRSQHPSS